MHVGPVSIPTVDRSADPCPTPWDLGPVQAADLGHGVAVVFLTSSSLSCDSLVTVLGSTRSSYSCTVEDLLA